MTIVRALFTSFVIAVLCAATPVFAGDTILFVPSSIDLRAYPLKDGPLTDREAATLGLQPMLTITSMPVYNWHRKPGRPLTEGRFEIEELSAQALVWADHRSGLPIYKASCGNRISPWLPPAATPAVESASPAKTQEGSVATVPANEPGLAGWLARRGRAVGGLVDGVLGGLYRFFIE